MDGLRPDDRGGRPLRILWLIDSLAMGGAERLAVSFARGAADAALDVRACCLKRIGGNPLESALRDTGVPVHFLGAAHLRDRRAFGRLRQLLREERVDVLHAHLTYATIWGIAAARLEKVPCVSTLHVPPDEGPAWGRARLRERLMCALLRRSGTTAVAVSAALRERYVRRGLLERSRVVVLPNGVDVDPAPGSTAAAADGVRAEFALPPDARLLMATAVLRECRKGVHVLLEALPRVLSACPRARLIVIGDGPLRAGLEMQARRLGIESAVRWAGARQDVSSLLSGAEIFVHPALDDPFPTAVLEAMAARLPVVASAVDGIPEMIDEGRNGRLVAPGDAEALAGALTELLGNERLRTALGSAAYSTAVERFSTAAWVNALRDLYERMRTADVPVSHANQMRSVTAP